MPRRSVKIGDRQLALDARPDRLDLRDRTYQPEVRCLPPRWPGDDVVKQALPAYAAAGLIRDQGQDGACTGFGLAAVIDYQSFVEALKSRAPDTSVECRRASPAMLYELARLYDEWPGEDYEGSSCRGALKGWHRHGVCREELWSYRVDENGQRVFVAPVEDRTDRDDPACNWDRDALRCTLGMYYRIDARSVVDMQAAISSIGAIYCSATVHEGWDVRSRRTLHGHTDLVQIRHVPTPEQPGGHAFAIVGYDEAGFVVQNSWGEGWGSRGFALLPYADWVCHGQDAWVFTLGVPRVHETTRGGRKSTRRPLRSPSFFVPSTDPGQRAAIERPVGLIAGADSLDRSYESVPARFRPLETDLAYRHTLVLDRGFPVRNDITARDPAHAVERLGYDYPKAWLDEKSSNKIFVYAHGGLNSESDALTRVRILAPYALEHGIYPLFISWRTGALETVSDLVEELFARLGFGARGVQPAAGWSERITECTDRLLEPLLRTPGGALWQQMKLNGQRASDHAAGGCRALVEQLGRLATGRPNLEIHLVGHSAGAIILGAMLHQMHQQGLRAASLRLLAPACTVDFALRFFKPAVESNALSARHWHIHTLSDRNERSDSVGPYRKSLLYLVSRAFEDRHKTPLLGLERAFDAEVLQPGSVDDIFSRDAHEDLEQWQSFWNGLGFDKDNRISHVLTDTHVHTGNGQIPASHGCFDNSVEVLGDTLGYIANPDEPKRIKIHRLTY